MNSIGYYLPQYNFSVELINGIYCQVFRQQHHIIATDKNVISVIHNWASINRNKFKG